MADSIEQYTEVLRAEAREADRRAEGDAAERLRRLAGSTDEMTPAERTWAAEASEEQLRSFAEALRSGCSPEEAQER